MSKHLVLMREVVVKHHRDFVGNPGLISYALKHPEIFNIEKLTEISLDHASNGNLRFIDGAHKDYNDGSDCKTASISINSRTKKGIGCFSHQGEISGVKNVGGNFKEGALRCIIYNPFADTPMYYFLPLSFWANHVTIHPTSKTGKIRFNYNRKSGVIEKLDDYRVSSFVELARKTN